MRGKILIRRLYQSLRLCVIIKFLVVETQKTKVIWRRCSAFIRRERFWFFTRFFNVLLFRI